MGVGEGQELSVRRQHAEDRIQNPVLCGRPHVAPGQAAYHLVRLMWLEVARQMFGVVVDHFAVPIAAPEFRDVGGAESLFGKW